MMERTGEIGEPWGVPTSETIGSDRMPLNLRRTLLSARKELRRSTDKRGVHNRCARRQKGGVSDTVHCTQDCSEMGSVRAHIMCLN